jgi:hypothetical protein
MMRFEETLTAEVRDFVATQMSVEGVTVPANRVAVLRA